MQRIATILAGAALAFVFFGATPSIAGEAQVQTSATDISAQNRPRPRTSLTVRPRTYPYRRGHSIYPLPYAVDYPGPNAVRQCVARYVEEHRPSGTVIVPRMRCWWERG